MMTQEVKKLRRKNIVHVHEMVISVASDWKGKSKVPPEVVRLFRKFSVWITQIGMLSRDAHAGSVLFFVSTSNVCLTPVDLLQEQIQ